MSKYLYCLVLLGYYQCSVCLNFQCHGVEINYYIGILDITTLFPYYNLLGFTYF